MSEFAKLVSNSNMEEHDKQTLKYAYEFLQGRCPPHFTSRSILLSGDTGIGKTYIAERLLASCGGWTVIVGGASRLKGENVKRCKNLKDVVVALKSTDKAAVFIDDIDYIMEKKDTEYSFRDKKELMELLEEVKLREDAFLLVTANSASLDCELLDRFDSKIDAEFPSDSEKTRFLLGKYSNHVDKKLLEKLSNISIGHNFRDLAEVIRMAYRGGNGSVSASSLDSALHYYTPNGLYGYKVARKVDVNFSSIIGRESIKDRLGAGIADRFAQINFGYPDFAERAEFFRKKAEKKKIRTGGFEISELAKATDKKSFRDMEKLWESIVSKHFETDKPVSSEEFLQLRSDFVKEQEAEAISG